MAHRRLRRCRPLLVLGAGLLLASLSLPANAFNRGTGLSGSFPVVSFAGYTLSLIHI